MPNKAETLDEIVEEMRHLSRCGGLCFVGPEGMAALAERVHAAGIRLVCEVKDAVNKGWEIALAGESAKIAEILSDGRDSSEAAEKLRRHLAELDAEYAKPRDGAR